MPYALCPMPYAHEYLIFLRKAIVGFWEMSIIDGLKPVYFPETNQGSGNPGVPEYY